MTNATEFVPSAVGAAAACGYMLNALKGWKRIPWLNQHSAQINAAVRAAVSLAATLGIGIAWDGVQHTLTITGLSAVTILGGLWHWFTTYAVTHGWEKIFSITAPTAQGGK